jgi:hypothetical protein
MESGFVVCVFLMVAVTLDLHTLVFDWLFLAMCESGELYKNLSSLLPFQ